MAMAMMRMISHPDTRPSRRGGGASGSSKGGETVGTVDMVDVGIEKGRHACVGLQPDFVSEG